MEKVESFISQHVVKVIGFILATIIAGMIGWMNSVNDQLNELTVNQTKILTIYENQSKQMERLTVVAEGMLALDKRLSRVEDIRFTREDGKKIAENLSDLKERVIILENKRR